MKQRTLRLIVRSCFLAAAIVFLLPILPWPAAAVIVPAASPLVMICSAVAGRSLGIVALAGLPVLLVALVSRRWFCRWACPMGLLVDVAERSRASRKSAAAAWPAVGRWLVLLTLAGACFGYPLLLCLDPLAMLTGCVGILGRPLNGATLIPALGLPAVLILSVLLPGAWCRRTCPLGAVQDLSAMPRQLMLRRRIAAEGQALLDRSPGRSFGIERRRLARRSILAAGLGAASAVLITRRLRTGRERPLRPPGAVEESRFTGICIRCGNCIRACPTRIIQPDPGRHGIAGLLAPVLDFGNDYCKADCNRCTQVCPSGAIARLALADKQAARIGLAVVDMEACIVNEATCSLCIDICPYYAIRSRWDEESYQAVIEVEAAKCPGCGACETVCPAKPKKAIVVEPGL